MAKKSIVDVEIVGNDPDRALGFKEIDTAVGLVWEFSNGDIRTLALSSFPANVQRALMFHGAIQKIRDSWSGKEVDEALELYDTVVENLTNGIWNRERAGGPRISVLVEAIVRYLEKDKKQEVSEERKENARKSLVSDEAKREAAKNDPAIMKHYNDIMAEKAAERAKEASKAAKGVTTSMADEF